MTRQQIILSELGKLDEQALVQINSACCDHLREIRRKASLKAKSMFSVGDTVGFGEAGARGKMSFKIGELTAIKRTKARVRVGVTIWTVPLNMLQHVP